MLIRFETPSQTTTYVNPRSVILIGSSVTQPGCSEVHVAPGVWCTVNGTPDEVAKKLAES